jgi:cytoskeleton protein RodZ
VLAALPETAPPSSLGYPSLAPTPRPMGELPAEVNNKPSLARWAIPLALVAVVTVAAIYEMTRPPTDQARTAAVDKPLPASTQVVPADAPATPPANMVTALPNPLAASDDRTGVAPDSASAAPTAEVATAQGADAGEALIALSFRARSWVEVRDAAGVLILSITGNAGDSQAVNGRPPFEVVLGNAAAVSVSWQGKAFDTAPYTRQNVARFTLR